MAELKRRRIGVMGWLISDHGRRVLTGALQYAEAKGAFNVDLIHITDPHDSPKRVQGLDGVVVALSPNELWRVKGLRLPMVFVAPFAGNIRMPSVTVDPVAVARLAAEHLLSLRLEQFIILGHHQTESFKELRSAFREAVEPAGGELIPGPSNLHAVLSDEDATTELISGLPVPCGILNQKDSKGIPGRAMACGRRVPEDIAVMGIGDDVVKCMTSDPMLSSIRVPMERMGWLAAEMLFRMIGGEKVESARVPPTGVVARESTNMLAIRDDLVVSAVLYIREHFRSPVTANDVARHVGICRSALHDRFRKALNCSVHEELTRHRLDRATAILVNTETPVKAIAIAVGIPEPANFNRFIKKHTGLSPRELRKRG